MTEDEFVNPTEDEILVVAPEGELGDLPEPEVAFVVPAPAYESIATDSGLDSGLQNLDRTEPEAPTLEAIATLGEGLNRKLDALPTLFDREIRAESTREKVVDRLHAELQEYKQGLLLGILRPVFVDLIQLHDDMGKMVAAQAEPEGEVARLLDLIRGFQQGIEDILYRQGVEPFALDDDAFDPRRQRAALYRPDRRSRPQQASRRSVTKGVPGGRQGDPAGDGVGLFVQGRAVESVAGDLTETSCRRAKPIQAGPHLLARGGRFQETDVEQVEVGRVTCECSGERALAIFHRSGDVLNDFQESRVTAGRNLASGPDGPDGQALIPEETAQGGGELDGFGLTADGPEIASRGEPAGPPGERRQFLCEAAVLLAYPKRGLQASQDPRSGLVEGRLDRIARADVAPPSVSRSPRTSETD